METKREKSARLTRVTLMQPLTVWEVAWELTATRSPSSATLPTRDHATPIQRLPKGQNNIPG